MFLFNVLHKSRFFFKISDFVARMGILRSKLEVCLPQAYPSTIYKHFSSLRPLILTSKAAILKNFLPRWIVSPLLCRSFFSLRTGQGCRKGPGKKIKIILKRKRCSSPLFGRLCEGGSRFVVGVGVLEGNQTLHWAGATNLIPTSL